MMIDAKKHLVTIIYNPAYDDIKGITMYGDDETYSHANAINSIEMLTSIFTHYGKKI